MSMFVRWKSAVAVAIAISAVVACQSGRDEFGDGANLLLTDGGAEAEAQGPTSCGGQRCSRDLHRVLDDCTGAVMQECEPTLGCAAGACVNACDSAAEARGSIGCSFWTTPPDVPTYGETSCYVAYVANTWSTPVTVTAEFGADPLDISRSTYSAIPKADGSVEYQPIQGSIPAGDLAIVFLSQGEPSPNNSQHIGCPYGVNVAYQGIVAKEHRTSLTKAFHLTTDVPVSAYSMFPFGGAKSYLPAATLLLPTPSWGTNYLVVDGWQQNTGNPIVQLVAQEDDTEIRIRPRVDIRDGVDVVGTPKGAVGSYVLGRGQVLELNQPSSLAGSPIESSRPIALFGGNQCAYVPDGVSACDSLHQQIAPLHEWSSAYSAVPYETRRQSLSGADPSPEEVTWRIAAASDGTILTYAPAPPGQAPAKLESGQVATFTSDEPFSVRSQDVDHPIYVAVYMSGGDKYRTLGDPDFVNVIPDDQFLDHYVFFIDHTYSDSNLTVVRRKESGVFHDVTLDCIGPISGWKPLGTDGSVEYAWVDMTKGYVPTVTQNGQCNYGRHEADSDGPFALYVWGLDSYASYGFPAGAGSRPTSPYQIIVR